MNKTISSKIGLAIGTALLGLSSGCIGYVDGPRDAGVYAQPPSSLYVETGVAAQDDYVYYPAYQVYYSSERRQYVYLDGRSWVSRPLPPHVAVNVLFASPSVNIAFHDSPAHHHAEVVKQYPKQWRSPEQGRDNHEDYRPADQGRNHQ
jgi:hypothetical protein